jgi:hypothetical protein
MWPFIFGYALKGSVLRFAIYAAYGLFFIHAYALSGKALMLGVKWAVKFAEGVQNTYEINSPTTVS